MKHTVGYYIMFVGLIITLVNIVMPWPVSVSLLGFGIVMLGYFLGEWEIRRSK